MTAVGDLLPSIRLAPEWQDWGEPAGCQSARWEPTWPFVVGRNNWGEFRVWAHCDVCGRRAGL